MEVLQGTFTREIASFGRNDNSSLLYFVGQCEVANHTPKYATVCGIVAEPLIVGMRYEFTGKWVHHAKYGKQFQFQFYTTCKPATRNGGIACLCRCRRLTRRMAGLIWDRYGEQCLTMLATKPEQVIAELALPADAIFAASDFFRNDAANASVLLRLLSIFVSHNLPRALALQVVERFGASAADVIEGNPFLLMEFPGVGFKRADAIWLSLGKDKNDIRRIVECLKYGISNNKWRHVWLSQQECLDVLGSYFDNPHEALQSVWDHPEFATSNNCITSRYLATQEQQIANKFHQLLQRS